MGSAPYWYVVVAAARYLKVPPWELEQRPIFWTYAASAASYAENHAAEVHSKQK